MKLEKVLSAISDEKVMISLLQDITTPNELKALQERLDIAFMLNDGMSYSKISASTKSSTTTVTRVARFLKQEKHGGYRWLFKNLELFKD